MGGGEGEGGLDDVAEAQAEVVADDAVHADLLVRAGVVGEDDGDGVAALLPLHEHRVPAEQLELVHLRLSRSSLALSGPRRRREEEEGDLGEGDDGVVVVDGLVDDEPVGLLLGVHDGRGQVLLPARRTRFPAKPSHHFTIAQLRNQVSFRLLNKSQWSHERPCLRLGHGWTVVLGAGPKA